jgi:flagellar biosynthetic protein FliP
MTTWVCLLALVLPGPNALQDTEPARGPSFSNAGAILDTVELQTRSAADGNTSQRPQTPGGEMPDIRSFVQPDTLSRSAVSIALFGAVSLIPVVLLVLTAFVRISVVLYLVRQALGSAQIPGNNVLTALALLLTVLVMAPVARRVYDEGIAPYAAKSKDAAAAWRDGTTPIKRFMGEQIIKSKHHSYLWTFYRHAVARSQGTPEPQTIEEFPLRVVAPAFLVSELTTALLMGFAIYLPFLIVDLVVSVVLSTMGLFLLPPGLVSVPIKLALFVLADGWMLVADMLVRSFG